MASLMALCSTVLVLFSGSTSASTVRRIGCLVELGSEMSLVKQQLLGELYRGKDKANKDSLQQLWGQRQMKLNVQQLKTGQFKIIGDDSDSMTIQQCVARCWRQRYSLSALQNGRRCLCSDTQDGLDPVDSALCYERCSGNCKQRCGGRAAMSVYHTGYETEPQLKPVNLYKGLLGCFPDTTLRDWCGNSLDQEQTFSGQHLKPREEAEGEGPDGVRKDREKPPLFSSRMSALLCTTYCISEPYVRQVAVLQTSERCCCGRSVLKSLLRVRRDTDTEEEDRDGFDQFCTEPCADPTSGPLCVGDIDGVHYVSVYDTFATWPEPSARPGPWYTNATVLGPIFPSSEYFEVSGFKEPWRKMDSDELLGVNPRGPDSDLFADPALAVDAANEPPWVLVMDDADEDDEPTTSWPWTLLAIFLLCLLLFLAIVLILTRRKKKNDDSHSFSGKRVSLDQDYIESQSVESSHSDESIDDQNQSRAISSPPSSQPPPPHSPPPSHPHPHPHSLFSITGGAVQQGRNGNEAGPYEREAPVSDYETDAMC